MLDIKFIRENPDKVKWACEAKGFADNVGDILKLDVRVRELKTLTETKTAEKNKISREIATAADKNALIAESKKIGDEIEGALVDLGKEEHKLKQLMFSVPQVPSADSPKGKSDSENVVTRRVDREPAQFDFAPRPHYELLDMNKWWVGDKIAKISGSRTYTLMGEAAELDLAIQTFVIKKLIAKGFTYITVPAIVHPKDIFDAGHFSGNDMDVMKNDVFMLGGNEYMVSGINFIKPESGEVQTSDEPQIFIGGKALAGTAEIVLNSLHRDEILDEAALPIKYAGYSPCYRKEAGAAGRDTRGLIRVHQFHKVEQFIFCRPEESDAMHAELLAILEEVMIDLELPYHVLAVCTGDMGFNKVRQDDIEAWSPAEGKYRELGSCSSIGEFQARRTNTRYRAKDGSVKFCATLNNTAIALPRALAMVLENHQNADGSVNVPAALVPLMDGRTKIGAK